MRNWLPRSSKDTPGRVGLGEVPSDVFEQPERSLLGEALARPVGLFSALLILISIGVFVANSFYLKMDRIDDYALVAFFVGGGVLLSLLLRAGDPNSSRKQDRSRAGRPVASEEDLILEEPFAAAGQSAAAPGFAEAGTESSPVPPAALVPAKAVKPAPDPVDDEVASFQRALVHYVDAGDFHGQGEVLRRLGHLAKARGHLKESREFYMNARGCFRKTDDHYAEAAVLLDLGQVLESLDEHDAASAAYRDANRALLDVAMNSGDRHNAIQAHAAD
ncbi:MAG: tetratricopeptide repeat protein [Geminicoccaceae bacterium]